MKIASIVDRKGSLVISVPETVLLGKAMETMFHSNIGSVVVLDRVVGSVIGIISQQELVAAAVARGGEAMQLPVHLFMRKPVLVCNCQDDAATVMGAMTLERSRHAVVLTQGSTLAGLVSLGDLVAALLEEAQLEVGVLRDMARSRLMASLG
ncbi:CBS domain-containing protein [Blastomonas sp.]|uniref:CBS domain-containing protein n=1 Tax=Blastomonas sp. TaxID=1909299 RepID=UPI003593CFAB